MKKIIAKVTVLALAALLTLAFMPAFLGTAKADEGGYNISDDGFIYAYNSNLNGYVIIAYAGDDSAVNIPAYIGDTRVVRIESGTFSIGYMFGTPSVKITSVTFPHLTADELNGVGPISVGDGVFSGQDKLATVDLSDSALLSGQEPFYGDTGLTAFACSADNPYNAVADGVLFSLDMSELIQYPPVKAGTYAIPSGVTTLDLGCFQGSRNLTAISFPATLDGVTGDMFTGCTALSEIDTANPAYSAVDGVLFKNNNDAESTLTLWCFPPAKAGSYTIPDKVTALAAGAFDSAAAVTGISLPAGLADLGTDLTTSNKNANPFAGCTSLQAFNVADENGSFSATDGVLFSKDGKTLIAYPPARTPTENSIYAKRTVKLPDFKAETGRAADAALKALPKGLPEKVRKAALKAALAAAEKPSTSQKAPAAVQNGVKMSGLYTVPDNVTSIVSGAFGHTTLTVVAFSQKSSIAGIGDYAFDSNSTVSLSAVSDDSNNDQANAVYAFVKEFAADNNIPFIEGKPFYKDFGFSIKKNNAGVFYATITSYKGTDSNVTIPDEVVSNDSSYPVMEIGDNAFSPDNNYNEAEIMHVAIPKSVTKIGKYAFEGCMNLTGVLKIPDSVTQIGEGCFADCYSLTGVILPNTLASLSDYTFIDCMSLTDVEIPSTVTSLGEACFNNCAITEISIPDGVTSIGEGCFDRCSELKSVALPDNLTALQDDTFYNCYSLETVTFGAGSKLETIGEACFAESGLTALDIPDGVTSIGQRCFEDCVLLESVTLPSGVGVLEDDTFSYCTSLKSITIPDNVSSIGSECFQDCYSLTGIAIPKNVLVIGDGAFTYCDSLKAFDVDAGNTAYQSSADGVLFNKTKTGAMTELICYPSGSAVTAYEIPDTVPNIVTKVDDYAFTGPASAALASVTVHKDVKYADNAFGADSLQHIYVDQDNATYANNFVGGVSDGVLYDHGKKSIIFYPFGKADKVYSIPSTMTTVASPSLCWRLFETVNIPASVSGFEYNADSEGGDEGEAAVKASDDPSDPTSCPGIFSYCPNLLNINVDPANPYYTSANGVVYANRAKTSILLFPTGRTGDYTIPNGVMTIKDFAFDGASLSRVFFPAGKMKFGEGAFADGMLDAAVFYGSPYIYNWDEYWDGPFDDEMGNFIIYYHIGKTKDWANFSEDDQGFYDTQPFCTLTLNFQNGQPSQKFMSPIDEDYHIDAPDVDTTLAGCTFAGWFKDAACTHAWNYFTDTARNDITLYARWMSDAPADLKAEPKTYNTIKLSWTPVQNAAGYVIKRAAGSGSYKTVATVKSTVQSFTDKNLTTGTPYSYTVQAFTQAGKNKFYGNPSDPAIATTVLTAPAFSSVTAASYKSVKISWGKVAGATKYTVYRSTTNEFSTATALKTTSARSYTDNGALLGTYYYWVKAIRGGASSLSDASKAVTSLNAPVISKVTGPAAGVYTVSWKAVDGATGYEVFVDGVQVGSDTAKTSFAVSGLTSGVLHSITVKAFRWVDLNKVTSIDSTPYNVTP